MWDLHLTNASQRHSISLLSFNHTLHSATAAVKPDWDPSAGARYAMLPIPLPNCHFHVRVPGPGSGYLEKVPS